MKTSSLDDLKAELMKDWRFRVWYYLMWPGYRWLLLKTKMMRHLSGLAR